MMRQPFLRGSGWPAWRGGWRGWVLLWFVAWAGPVWPVFAARGEDWHQDSLPPTTLREHKQADDEGRFRPPGPRRLREEGFRGGREGRGAGLPFEWPQEVTVREGFLFVNGEYISPPYHLEVDEEGLRLNGKALGSELPRFGPGVGGPGFGGMGPPGFGLGGFGPPRAGGTAMLWRRVLFEVEQHLMHRCAVLLFEGQPTLVLDSGATYDLLASLTRTEGRSLRQVSLEQRLPPEFDRDVWDAWITSYVPPPELRDRAAVLIRQFEFAEQQLQEQMQKNQWKDSLAYPLTVFGMILTVLATGHLLGGRPHAGKSTAGIDASPEMIRALEWSLFFAVALSVFDLAWTILAADGGMMQELNPLGRHLLEDPRQLAGFKMGATLPAVGVLWLLRKYKRAQVAAWWVCFVLTIVAFRWLTFHSISAA